MSKRMRPRVSLHAGPPPGEVSMPTCGVCHQQIGRGEAYASVLNREGDLREVRHNTKKCLRYEYGPATALRVGAKIYTRRYTISDWGGVIPGVITERTEEFGMFGWRAYMIAPEDPSDTSMIDRMRSHPEEFFRKMAETLTVDPEPRKVFISDKEWTHYVLPD